VELGVWIEPETRTERQLHALQLKKAYLNQQRFDIRRTTYRLDNRTAEAKIVLIEHQPAPQFHIFDTSEPFEKTLDTYRYRVEAPPGDTVVEFTVQERHLQSQRVELEDLSYRELQNFLEHKFLDKGTYDKLKELLDGWAAIEKRNQGIEQQETRRAKIYEAQAQVQKNMSGLANTGEEGKLRGRYVQQLAASEEELAEIDREIERLQGENAKIKAQLQEKIEALAG
jgi:hypothetical protein